MKQKILVELQLSVTIVLSREEVVPRFHMRLVFDFLAWKSATAFILSSELKEPDIMLSAAVSRNEVACACRPIIRQPLGVGAIEWLPQHSVGDEVVALLPRGNVVLDRETEAALVRAFGTGGVFEARRS